MESFSSRMHARPRASAGNHADRQTNLYGKWFGMVVLQKRYLNYIKLNKTMNYKAETKRNEKHRRQVSQARFKRKTAAQLPSMGKHLFSIILFTQNIETEMKSNARFHGSTPSILFAVLVILVGWNRGGSVGSCRHAIIAFSHTVSVNSNSNIRFELEFVSQSEFYLFACVQYSCKQFWIAHIYGSLYSIIWHEQYLHIDDLFPNWIQYT